MPEAIMVVDRFDRESGLFATISSQKGTAAFRLCIYQSSSGVALRCQREKPKTLYTTIDKRSPQSGTVCFKTTYQGKN